MKILIMRCLLVVTLGLLLTLVVLLPGIKKPAPASAYAPPHSGKLAPKANFHLWVFNEIFSCADGSIQFIELFSASNGQEVLANHPLRARNSDLTQTKVFTFPTNSGAPTAGKYLLLATANFGALSGGVTPDFVISSTFIFTNGGDLTLLPPPGPEFDYAPGALPLDGIQSLGADGTTVAVNSPRNFAGTQGSIVCPGTINADLTVTKKAPTTVISGNRITYTLTVTSTGTTSNTTVILTDTIPSGTTFATASELIQPVNGVLTWTLGTLNPSTVVSRTFAVTANLAAGSVVNNNYGVLSDQASAAGAPVTTTVVATQALLALNKKGPAITVPGSRITYTLTVTSSGNIANTNVVLTDTIPSGAVFASADVTPVNDVLTWTLGTLNPSTVVSRTFAVTVNVPVGSNVVNNNYRVRSDQTSATGAPVTTMVAAPQALLALSKKGPTTVIPDGRITYTLTVTSSGTIANSNVILTDTLPASTTFASALVQPVNGVVTWNLGTLNASAVVSRTLAVTVNAPAGAVIVNNKYGVRSNETNASGPAVNVNVVAAQSFLAVTKKAPATVNPGRRITYTLTVTSSGNAPNTNVILTDTLPANTTFASALVQPVNGVLTWPLGSLNPLVVVSRTFVVTVNNVVSGTNIINNKYGVRSNQANAGGLPVTVKVAAGQSQTHLPVILKNFVPPSEHDADLILPPDHDH